MHRILIFISLITILAALSCTSPTGPGVGRLDLYIQDGVADYDSVFVTIDSIFIKPAMDSANWDLIYPYPLSFELIHLRDGEKELVTSRDVSVGEITGLRLQFSSARVVVDGVSYDMSLPSMNGESVLAEASGGLVLIKNEISPAIVDINLFSSITYNESLAYYEFDPHFTFASLDSTGSISGSTTPAADIYLFPKDSGDTLSYTFSQGDSLTYGFYNVPHGYYDMLLKPRGDDTLTYQSLFEEDLPVTIGNDYDLGQLVLPSP